MKRKVKSLLYFDENWKKDGNFYINPENDEWPFQAEMIKFCGKEIEFLTPGFYKGYFFSENMLEDDKTEEEKIFTEMISKTAKLFQEENEVKNDPVNSPSHYVERVPGIECIEVTQHFNFNLGNVIKYVWRSGSKGNAIEDLKKARKYLDFEIKRLGGE